MSSSKHSACTLQGRSGEVREGERGEQGAGSWKALLHPPISALMPGVKGGDSGKLRAATKSWYLMEKTMAAKMMH